MGKLDPARFISKRYTGRESSIIRKIISDNMGVPGMLTLAGGLPNPKVFPMKGMTFSLADGTSMEMQSNDVEAALQYGPSGGFTKLVTQLKHIQKRFHNSPSPTNVLVGTGSQSLLARTFDMLLNPGDPLLLEAPSYPGALSALQPIKPRFVPIKADGEGLLPGDLRSRLDSWDVSTDGPKPKVLYCIPTGQNPSGATMPYERKVEVYRIAQEHDLIIMEDDPYYFLYLGKAGATSREAPASFQSMDVDSRVIRFDSLSKVLSSGLRTGFMSGHPDLLAPILKDIESTDLHTSQLSQLFVASLLERWGDAGWDKHVAMVKDFYAERRDRFIAACEKHLTGLADWTYPEAGMFVWFRFRNVPDTMDLIMKEAKAEKVLLVPGQPFFTDGKPSNCVRASYSVASDEDMDEALRRLASLLRKKQ
ncbi:hypothetical protein DIPPA_04517 [Diplonema papillatum]|nr:hypothetical protein DIPPA_04517 [Diplonema papillatum]